MNGPRDRYLTEMHARFGYFATWYPGGAPLKIGDVGCMNGNVFTPLASLSDFNLKPAPPKMGPRVDLSYSSAGKVSIEFKASGSSTPPGSLLSIQSAGVIVEFGEEGAVLFEAVGAQTQIADNITKLGQEIINLYKNPPAEGPRWESHYCLITEVVQCDAATIMISDSAKGKVEMTLQGSAGDSGLKIADAKLGLSVAYARNVQTRLVAAAGLTPLFQAARVVVPWFAAPRFERVHPAAASSQPSAETRELTFEPIRFQYA
ncbi:MAG: hypothetical protein JWL69_1090 [Phycisphaerales bacterium]|nr:hypothetical protein [Phycisphaerales bacterium]MDB5357602.1 hypothetical protein [Phycisphaerales bacterium]